MTVFPTSLIHFGVEPDIRKLMEDAEDIYHQTGIPLCPCLMCFLCIFCFRCAAMCCMDRRESRLEKLASDFNEEHEHQGILITFVQHYIRGRTPRGFGIPKGIYVHLNVPKRREYCALNGIDFQMPETLPFPQPKIVPESRSSHRSFWSHSGGEGGDGCGDGGGGDGGGGCGGGD